MNSDNASPPPLLARLFRAPGWLYRMGLGWILGKRFLALTHRGRRTGREYRTVLEVIAYDETSSESIVVSAYGTGADWYLNIEAEPALRVETGRVDYVPEQRFLDPEERKATARSFCLEHPWEAKLMPRVLTSIGAAVSDDSEVDADEMLARLPMVALKPAD